MERSKVASYIGFAIRSNNYRKGIYSIKQLRSAGVLIVDKECGKNTMKEAFTVAKRLNCPLVYASGGALEEASHISGCKFMAITDKNLAEGVLGNLGGDFDLMKGGRADD